MIYEIETFLTASTAHISPKDNELLMLEATGLIVYPYKEGFWIRVPDSPEQTNGLSKALKKLLKITANHQCLFLRLDRDGPVYEDLETFDW